MTSLVLPGSEPSVYQPQRFILPADTVYLDGNSLGPPLIGTTARLAERIDDWGSSLISSWNDHDWIHEPQRLGNRIAALIGAGTNTVSVGDTLSVSLFQALSAALCLQQSRSPERRKVLTDSGNFPGDLYVASGLLDSLHDDYELCVVAPEEVAAAIDDSIAVLMLTEVDFRTARKHDMRALCKLAREAGVVTLWDLAHSAGAIPVALSDAGADFAVGCTYKYLNGGPGAPAFIYERPQTDIEDLSAAIQGWLGHIAPFAFDRDFRAAKGVGGLRIGTPPVLAMRVLDTALDVFDGVSLDAVAMRSGELSEQLINSVARHCPTVALASPRDPLSRGSHVSFSCAHAYPVMQALIKEHRVIGDVRAPDLLRFGVTPLYINETDITRCVEALAFVLDTRSWDKPEYHRQSAVT